MEMDPNPPSFNIPMNVAPLNIGEAYAKGMEAGTAAGKPITEGMSAVADVMMRNQRATDMLNAMHQGGMLDDKAYAAVAGKSLGAQEQMLGMYANQWIADQANQRALSLARGQAGVDVAKAHAQLLDTYNQAKAGNVAAIEPKKMLWQPPVQQQTSDQTTTTMTGQQPPMSSKAGGPLLPGTRYGAYTDEQGNVKKGYMLPSGQFIEKSTLGR